ncbi:MAG: PA14 domain-containing protein [Planctomycetota bacterium]
MCRKLLFLTSLILVLSLFTVDAAFGTIIDIRIADGGDDAEQHLDDGSMDIGSTDLELPYEDAGNPTTDEQAIGLRFVGVPLEAGTTVADAYVEIEVDKVNKEGSQAPVNLIIEGELALDAAAFEDVAGNITDRPTTAAKVKWSIPEWTEQNAKFQSPDVSSIIQEIISQEGWASGSAIVLIIRDDKDNPSTGLREAESYDGEADAAPLLRITLASEIDIRVADGNDDAEEHLDDGDMDVTSSDLELPYEDAGSPATDEQAIGLRFLDLPMDMGGKVVSAYVEFEVDSVSKEGTEAPVNLIIRGELTPNAEAFADAAGNISGRPTTTAQVAWSVPGWTETNAKFQSPDISAVIQEIVNQEGWEAGNAVVLIITDDKDNPSTGLREAEAYDGEVDAAPLLHIVGALSIVRAATEPVPADGALGVSAAPAISTFVSSDVPKNIPDWSATTSKNIDGEVASTLDVADSIKIKDLNIELDITKPGNNADLNAFLKSPDGKEIKLFDDVGFNRPSNFTNTILDDEAGTSITSGAGPFTGIYKPEGNLSDFDGRNTKGTWRLKVIDDWPGGAGKINSWRIVVENPIMVSWIPGFDAASQDVYFSSSFADVNDGIALLGSVAGDAGTIEVGALALGTTYYWRVDTIGSDGTVYPSEIWSFSTPIGNIAVNQRITDGNDDVEERIGNNNGSMDITSSDLEFPYEDTGQGDPQIVGMRFVNVGVPAGAQIVESSLEFEVDETKGGTEPVSVLIGAELAPDAEAFSTTAGDVSSRVPAETLVPWSVPDWTANDVKFQTPDISALIEELINQEGWASGNAMVFTVQDDPCNPSLGVRCAEAYDGEPSAAPLLHVAAITEAAGNPSPANGAIDVVQETVLSWSPGFSGVSRTVYFGTENPPAKREATTGTSLDVGKLATSTTYYWRVDETDASGTKHTGSVWSFTTVIGEATNPDPADYAAGVPLDAILSWTPGATAVSSDVYFGADGALEFMGNQVENTFDPGGLAVGSVYNWRIDSIEADGTKHVGYTWMFKAPREGTGTILREVWEGISGTAVSDLTGNAAYPGNPTYSDEVSLFEAPIDFADNFGSRIHGWLHPDTSGDYIFWISSDDNSELWLSTDETPANAVLISQVTNWTDPRQFDDTDVIPSNPIPLEGGQKYYIKALYKEGGGGDNCAVAWEGPDNPERAVISGYYLTPFVALWADNPDPADGSTVMQTFALLTWTPGVTAASHNVYISESSDDVSSGAEAAFVGNQGETMLSVGLPGLPIPDGLGGATYYWRVDEVEADPNVVYQGAVWSFTVPPVTAYNPSPADGATDVAIDAKLSWTPGLNAKLHSVYFGDNLDTVTNAAGAPPLPLTTSNPGPLEAGKTYYWRVDEFNPPTTVTGDVWSFTTVAPAP